MTHKMNVSALGREYSHFHTFIRKYPLQVMKDWSDLEERYQDMRSEDPTSAEDFKKAMTERFQKTVQVCERVMILRAKVD